GRTRTRERARAGFDRSGDDRDPDAAACRGRTCGVVRKSDRGGRQTFFHAGAGEPVRHREARGHGRDHGRRGAARRDISARGRRIDGDVAPARTAAQFWRGDEIDLAKLPIQTCWPGEPAPLITWPLIVTKGPSDRREDNYNLGIYRM